MTQTYLAADGTALAYADEGEGMPLLCLPGLTRSMGDFDYLRPHLPPLRLIRVDYRGRGGSGWSGPASYTVPQEAQDVLGLLSHLGLDRVAVLGTSRGGLIGMVLAAMAKHRMLGLCLNDIGPEIHQPGLRRIADYVGRNPAAKTHAELAARLPSYMPGFDNVPPERWLAEVRLHYVETGDGLSITYDPSLREPFMLAATAPPTDLWPLFEACAGLPMGLLRGANSDLLTQACADEMRRRRPDMAFANVADRAHIPFLDEPESLDVIRTWLQACHD
jgi:pimeloyl-ACP methyl ester carboxylesterase